MQCLHFSEIFLTYAGRPMSHRDELPVLGASVMAMDDQHDIVILLAIMKVTLCSPRAVLGRGPWPPCQRSSPNEIFVKCDWIYQATGYAR